MADQAEFVADDWPVRSIQILVRARKILNDEQYDAVLKIHAWVGHKPAQELNAAVDVYLKRMKAQPEVSVTSVPNTSLTRGELVRALVWGAAEQPELISIVRLSGPSDKYTTSELVHLLDFSRRLTQKFRAQYPNARSANWLFVDKLEGDKPWLLVRPGWVYHNQVYATLDEALRTPIQCA